MSNYSNKMTTAFFLCFILVCFPVFASVNNTMYKIKKELLKLKIKHKAAHTLNYLIEEYEQYHSSFFVQEYANECNLVLKEIKNERLGDQYEQVVISFFKEVCRFTIISLQHKYARVIFSIREAILYWSYQYEHPFIYRWHKNPLKWFGHKQVSDEINEHVAILEKALKDYMIKLGQLVNYTVLLWSEKNDFSLEELGKTVEEIQLLYTGSAQTNSMHSAKQASFLRVLLMFASAEKDVESYLLEPIKNHIMPIHFERYWLSYLVGLGVGLVLFNQKNNQTSVLNKFVKNYHLLQYEQNFVKSFKKNFVLPFKQLGNILFGLPLDMSGLYPERFEPLVAVYNKDNNDAFALADRGYDKLPDNFDVKLSIPYNLHLPEENLAGYQLIWKLLKSKTSEFISKNGELTVSNGEWTEEQKEIFLQTNQIAGYALYKFLSAKADTLLTFLNMSHEIDLILKVIAIMPALGLVYGSYKGVQHIYKFAMSANYEPLHTILIAMQECIIESTVVQHAMDEDKSSYTLGKLFFLKYCAKKSAAVILTKDAYKTFLKDLKKIQVLVGDTNNSLQMIELIIKKYNINSIVC